MWWSPRSFARRAPSYRGAALALGKWTIQFGIPDGPDFMTPDVGPAFLVLGHEDVEGGLWALLWIAPLILLPLAIFWTFWLDHPLWPFYSYDDLFDLG
jgi:hypothetical protein